MGPGTHAPETRETHETSSVRAPIEAAAALETGPARASGSAASRARPTQTSGSAIPQRGTATGLTRNPTGESQPKAADWTIRVPALDAVVATRPAEIQRKARPRSAARRRARSGARSAISPPTDPKESANPRSNASVGRHASMPHAAAPHHCHGDTSRSPARLARARPAMTEARTTDGAAPTRLVYAASASVVQPARAAGEIRPKESAAARSAARNPT